MFSCSDHYASAYPNYWPSPANPVCLPQVPVPLNNSYLINNSNNKPLNASFASSLARLSNTNLNQNTVSPNFFNASYNFNCNRSCDADSLLRYNQQVGRPPMTPNRNNSTSGGYERNPTNRRNHSAYRSLSKNPINLSISRNHNPYLNNNNASMPFASDVAVRARAHSTKPFKPPRPPPPPLFQQAKPPGKRSARQSEDETSEFSDSSFLNHLIDSETDESDATFNTKILLNEEVIKRIERNQNCLTVLSEGDLIEYVEKESDLDDRDNNRMWAVFVGHSTIIRYCSNTKSIVSEPYWRIAIKNLIYINKDMDKRLCALPAKEVVSRAHRACSNTETYSKFFSSDKNFVTWCRFDINKSDIEFCVKMDNYSQSKEYLMRRFLTSIELDHQQQFTMNADAKETCIF